MTTKIIHIDMDCFYAQVEMRDRPELATVPLAIGGPPHSRSVLCTSNYKAREFGVRSAMPTDTAMKLCPELIVLPPNFHKYKSVSRMIHEIFNQYSDAVESVSLDEAYLDVSQSDNATEIALAIKKDILNATGLTCSVGIAPSKFLAKIASDWKKPNGHFVIKPHQVDEFVKNLPVRLIPGVGKKTNEILERLKIITCNDLRNCSAELLNFHMGKFSFDLLEYARGIDKREVKEEYERKSLSVENTFLYDLKSSEEIENQMYEVYQEMLLRLKDCLNASPEKKIKKIFTKIKYTDFKQSTTEESLYPIGIEELPNAQGLGFENFKRLISYGLSKRNAPIRLIGVGVRFLTSKDMTATQLSFFDLCGQVS